MSVEQIFNCELQYLQAERGLLLVRRRMSSTPKRAARL